MKEKSANEVKQEIAALKACKSYIPKNTAFGDDNHRNIDLMVEYLEGEIDTTAAEFEENFTESEQAAILDAQSWKNGDMDESFSSGWDGLKPKINETLLPR